MLLITRKSECKNMSYYTERNDTYAKIISKKETRAKAANNYFLLDDLVIDRSCDSYVSERDIIINRDPVADDFTLTLAQYFAATDFVVRTQAQPGNKLSFAGPLFMQVKS